VGGTEVGPPLPVLLVEGRVRGMATRVPGLQGEYLWELDIARIQLLALAEAAPDDMYGYRPAEGTRTFSAVLVHIAAVNFGLLHLAGARAAGCIELYGEMQRGDIAEITAMIRKNMSLERTLTGKGSVMEFLKRSFEAVQQAFLDADLEKEGEFFGERATVRRVYLRILAHSHEHMGQAVAYVRASGMRAPWPDPLKEFESTTAPVE